jgi:hypothetical protein
MVKAGFAFETGVIMKTTPSTPAESETTPSTPLDRRDCDRVPQPQWPEPMRDDFRRLEFLSGVEVQESDWAFWQDTVAAFKKR